MKLALATPDAAILSERMPDFRGRPGDLGAAAHAMLDFCRVHAGVGLAAPQVGIRQRMFVINLERHTRPGEPARVVCINPVVVMQGGQPLAEMEGCLTWPDQQTSIVRAEIVVAKFTDLRGKQRTRRLTRLWARVFLHEMDHLNGMTIFPRAATLHGVADAQGA